MPGVRFARTNNRSPGGSLSEWCVTVATWGSATIVALLFGWILVDISVRGLSEIDFTFLFDSVEDAGRRGGIGPILTSTCLILAVSMIVALPVAMATAIELNSNATRHRELRHHLRRSLDVLAGVPSIVFGLFGNAAFVMLFGLGYSILSGGFTLACMILPMLARSFEQALAAVPVGHRHAAAALGLGHMSTVIRVLLPTAGPGLVAGIVLSTGRALAETAALLFTSGYVTRMPESLFDSGRSLSVHIYDLAMNVPNGSSRAYATALVLVALLLIINLITTTLLRLAGLNAQEPGRLHL